MTVQIELWQLITLLLAFFGAVGAFGKILLDQIEKRIAARDDARTAEFKHLNETLSREADSWRRVERELLLLQAELPNQYVRRDDWIRFGGSIDSKMDALHQKFDELRGNHARG